MLRYAGNRVPVVLRCVEPFGFALRPQVSHFRRSIDDLRLSHHVSIRSPGLHLHPFILFQRWSLLHGQREGRTLLAPLQDFQHKARLGTRESEQPCGSTER